MDSSQDMEMMEEQDGRTRPMAESSPPPEPPLKKAFRDNNNMTVNPNMAMYGIQTPILTTQRLEQNFNEAYRPLAPITPKILFASDTRNNKRKTKKNYIEFKNIAPTKNYKKLMDWIG
jgi:hypothetical protein